MAAQPYSTVPTDDGGKSLLKKRLEELGWAVFFIMTGILWLLPSERVPNGAWLIGTGVILLAVNAVRYFNGVAISGFTTLLGALALAGGLSEFAGMHFPLLALCLIAFGVSIVLKPLLSGRK